MAVAARSLGRFARTPSTTRHHCADTLRLAGGCALRSTHSAMPALPPPRRPSVPARSRVFPSLDGWLAQARPVLPAAAVSLHIDNSIHGLDTNPTSANFFSVLLNPYSYEFYFFYYYFVSKSRTIIPNLTVFKYKIFMWDGL